MILTISHYRAEAAQRRLEHGHKEQLLNIHKQSIHLLRAINRFKGAVVTILEREHLPAAAADVERIEDLPTEEVFLNFSTKKVWLHHLVDDPFLRSVF